MDMRIPPLRIKIMLESNPLKSIMLVRRLAVTNAGQILEIQINIASDYTWLPLHTLFAECGSACESAQPRAGRAPLGAPPGRIWGEPAPHR